MALHHISPNKGVDACGAQTPATCKFKNSRHFGSEAAQRITSGNPQNYYETEAMHEHNAIQQKVRLEGRNKNTRPVPTPSPMPMKSVNKPTQFPKGHHNQQNQPASVLFHKDIGFPPNFADNPPKGKKELEWSGHAKKARLDDRYGTIPLLQSFNPENWTLIEMGVQPSGNGGKAKVEKFVYRTELDDDNDIVMVVIPKSREPWFVKTVWLNEKNDAHKTLDRSKYVDPNRKSAA